MIATTIKQALAWNSHRENDAVEDQGKHEEERLWQTWLLRATT